MTRLHATDRIRPPRMLGYRARQVLDYIRATIAEDGRAPSYGMICNALDIAHQGHVCRIVASLETRGLLRRSGTGRVRRIRLVVIGK